jgi:hypothetical protein
VAEQKARSTSGRGKVKPKAQRSSGQKKGNLGLDALASGIIASESDEAGRDAAAVAAEALDVIPGLRTPEGDGTRLRAHLTRWGAAPLLTLGALNVVDELDRIAFITLAPDIRNTFGLSDAAMGLINGLSGVLVVLMAIPVAALADRTRRRTLLAAAGGFLWATFALFTGLVRNAVQLVAARFLSGLGKATIDPVHGSLLADYYPAEARGRVYAAHQAANPIAGVLGPVLAGGGGRRPGGRGGGGGGGI